MSAWRRRRSYCRRRWHLGRSFRSETEQNSLTKHTQTHTHTHSFNGPFSGNTQVSRCQKGKTNPDFTEARDSESQWHQLGRMQVCTFAPDRQPHRHPTTQFLQADALPAAQPTASKHWRENSLTKIHRIFVATNTPYNDLRKNSTRCVSWNCFASRRLAVWEGCSLLQNLVFHRHHIYEKSLTHHAAKLHREISTHPRQRGYLTVLWCDFLYIGDTTLVVLWHTQEDMVISCINRDV